MAADLNSRVARLMDANVNRAREGLRVVEDAVRYIWDDKSLYTKLRAIRHGITNATKGRTKEMVESRQSSRDVGRKLKEGKRSTLEAVLIANMKRSQEAMRVLEEYSKFFSPRSAGQFKQLRYELYIQEKKVTKKI